MLFNQMHLKCVIVIFLCSPHQSGWSSLMSASMNGHEEVVRALILARAQVNRQDKVNYWALVYIYMMYMVGE